MFTYLYYFKFTIIYTKECASTLAVIMNTSPHKFAGIYNIASIVILKLTIADKQIAAIGIYISISSTLFT